MIEKMKVGGLFSGIGGFELGLERAGFEIKWVCEIDEFCRKVLRKHWPNITIFKDITSMFSAEDSPAKTYLTPANAPEYPGAVQDSGGSWCEPFAWYDRNTSSWRTWQRSLVEEWETWSETWPRAGMIRNGIAYQRVPLVPITSEIGSGLWPTPQAGDAQRFSMGINAILNSIKRRGHYQSCVGKKMAEEYMASPTPTLFEHLMGFPIGYTELKA